ncbi:MAG: serine proteinase [Clostridiales bacterium]|nr:serine proteinase [Clostridiales bacterium]
MALFDAFKDKAKDLAQTGVNKSRQLAEIAKLNLANTSEEDEIKRAYIEIGKLYYAEKGMAPDAAYVALCEKITAAKVTIEENKARIEEIKNQSNIEADEDPIIVTKVDPEEPVTPPESHTEDVPPEE